MTKRDKPEANWKAILDSPEFREYLEKTMESVLQSKLQGSTGNYEEELKNVFSSPELQQYLGITKALIPIITEVLNTVSQNKKLFASLAVCLANFRTALLDAGFSKEEAIQIICALVSNSKGLKNG